MSHIVAIDQGTTSTRCVLFDSNLKVLKSHSEEFKQHYPNPGWCEHDPVEILETVKTCFSHLGVTAKDIKSLGITNQRETTVAWDKTTGKPLHNAIVWLDARTSGVVKGFLGASNDKDRFRPQTGLPLATYFSAMKMRWLIENVDAVRNAVDANNCCFGTIESWLVYNLTGGKKFVTDVTNASRYLLMNLDTLKWDEQVCSQIGI